MKFEGILLRFELDDGVDNECFIDDFIIFIESINCCVGGGYDIRYNTCEFYAQIDTDFEENKDKIVNYLTSKNVKNLFVNIE